jgi:hypothetical protein
LADIRGNAEPIQKALDAIAKEQEIEVFPVGSGIIQQPLENPEMRNSETLSRNFPDQ